jgi:hypothetical protein
MRLRISGAKPHFPSYAFMARTEKSIIVKLRTFICLPNLYAPNFVSDLSDCEKELEGKQLCLML